jgi:hypothetical protein
VTARRFSCPEHLLADEIELAIAYTVACNPDRRRKLLLPPPQGLRKDFAREIALMLTGRAELGLSGMALAGDESPVKARNLPD